MAPFHHEAIRHSSFNLQDLSKTRRLAACTQAVVILRSTSYIAIELNILHLKSYEIQSNRYMCANFLESIYSLLLVCVK